MSSANTLIDELVESRYKSRRKLAAALHEDPAFLTRIAHGDRPTPPALAARLAAIAGMNPTVAALTAIVEGEDDPAKRAELVALFHLPLNLASQGVGTSSKV